jgi:hypothetical protein
LRVLVALTTTLLCSIPLYSSGASLAGTPSRPIGDKCFSHKAIGVSSTVCDFAVGQPFLLRGYSKGGPSTLSYTVQCGNDPSWPMSKAAIDRRVWYKRSLTVKGNFKVYGTKDTLSATRHCAAARGKAALLSVKLKMSKRVTRTNLVVRLDSSLPWGE